MRGMIPGLFILWKRRAPQRARKPGRGGQPAGIRGALVALHNSWESWHQRAWWTLYPSHGTMPCLPGRTVPAQSRTS
jgi:hypothetical protein